MFDDKENVDVGEYQSVLKKDGGSAKKTSKRRRRSSILRRVSFSNTVNIREFDKDDKADRRVSFLDTVNVREFAKDQEQQQSCVKKQTTVVLAERQEQIKAAHEPRENHVIPQWEGRSYASPSKTPSLTNDIRSLEDSPEPSKWGARDDLMSASKPKPLSNLPRPTSSVPTLSSLLNDNTSPYKPSITSTHSSMSNFQCDEDISMVFPRAVRKSSIMMSESSGHADMDMSLTGVHPFPEDDSMNESVEHSTSNLLASINKSPKQPQQQQEEDEEGENDGNRSTLYRSFVDNYVVNYDSDVSMTLNMKSLKVPGFQNLYDEEDDMSMTNINLQAPSSHNTSNNSELDMSMTHNFKTNPVDITNYNYADMSIMSHTRHNLSNTSMNESMDMSVTNIGKFAALDTSSANNSVDMSVTNIRIPTPTEDEEEDEGISGDRFGGYNNTLNNFAVTYDDNVDMTMRMSKIRYNTEEEEEAEPEPAISDAASDSKYNTSIDNFVVNYDDDIVETNNKSADQSMNSDVSMEMTMTKADFGKILAKQQEEEEEEAGEVEMDVSKQNISLRKEDLMNNSDVSIGSPAPAIIGKIITPRKSATKRKSTTPTSERKSKLLAISKLQSPSKPQSPAKQPPSSAAKVQRSPAVKVQQSPSIKSRLSATKKRLSSLVAPSPAAPSPSVSFSASPFASPSFDRPVRGLPASHQLSPAIPDFGPQSTNEPVYTADFVDGSNADMSANTMDEMLSMSMRKIDVPLETDDSFSFARFLQLANIPFFNSSRCSIAPPMKRDVEDPTDTEILKSAYITRHDLNDMQSSCEHLRTTSGEKKQGADRLEKLLASSVNPPKLFSQLKSEDEIQSKEAQKQAKSLRAFSKVMAKVEFLDKREQMNQKTLAAKRRGLELLRQDVAKLAKVKSIQVLNDELPVDIKRREEQIHTVSSVSSSTTSTSSSTSSLPKYFLSTASQTVSVKPKESKLVRTERNLALQRQMAEDCDVVQFMQQSLHWVPRIFTQEEILLHWDFYKIHILTKQSEVTKASFDLINPSVRLSDFHKSIMKNAQIEVMLQSLKNTSEVVPTLQKVFQRLQRTRLIFNTVKRLASMHPIKTDTTSDSVGVIEIQFSDHRLTTKFGVIFEITCAYPFTKLVTFPTTPLFGNVTVDRITKVLQSIEPGYECLELACAALCDLANNGKDL